MIQGSIVALITPFLADGMVDFEGFRKLVSWQIEQGSDALVVCGSTGESSTLSSIEQKQLIEIAALEANGRIPIIAGTGTNDTRVSVERTIQAKEAGADACLVILPYYNKPTLEGCKAHFKKIAECTLPIIVYYHPGRTGLSFTPKQLVELCSLPNVIGIKEASGDVDAALEFIHLSEVPLFTGNDTLALTLISGGARGSISIIGNIYPREWSKVVKSALMGDVEGAEELYQSLLPICQAMDLEINPQCIKYAMSLKGHCAPFLRLPLILPEEKTQKQIEYLVLHNNYQIK
jgi:4-hydroxy-tetrahydrodipicolinate synthase